MKAPILPTLECPIMNFEGQKYFFEFHSSHRNWDIYIRSHRYPHPYSRFHTAIAFRNVPPLERLIDVVFKRFFAAAHRRTLEFSVPKIAFDSLFWGEVKSVDELIKRIDYYERELINHSFNELDHGTLSAICEAKINPIVLSLLSKGKLQHTNLFDILWVTQHWDSSDPNTFGSHFWYVVELRDGTELTFDRRDLLLAELSLSFSDPGSTARVLGNDSVYHRRVDSSSMLIGGLVRVCDLLKAGTKPSSDKWTHPSLLPFKHWMEISHDFFYSANLRIRADRYYQPPSYGQKFES